MAPGAWEIDRYPIVRFSYRIPKGVPVGICVQPFTAPGLPKGVLLGGTDSRVTGGLVEVDTVGLSDDGQWHEATVDLRKVRRAAKGLKYLYRFMFSTNWRKDEGQEFWYDDFSILPAE